MIGYFADGSPVNIMIEIHKDTKGNLLKDKKSGIFEYDSIKKVKNIYPPRGWCSPEFHRRTDLRDRKTVRVASVFGPTPRRPKNVAEQIAFSHLFGNRWP